MDLPRWTGRLTVGRNITWTCVIALQITGRPLVREGTLHEEERT
jgi:hypothetical protein